MAMFQKGKQMRKTSLMIIVLLAVVMLAGCRKQTPAAEKEEKQGLPLKERKIKERLTNFQIYLGEKYKYNTIKTIYFTSIKLIKLVISQNGTIVQTSKSIVTGTVFIYSSIAFFMLAKTLKL